MKMAGESISPETMTVAKNGENQMIRDATIEI